MNFRTSKFPIRNKHFRAARTGARSSSGTSLRTGPLARRPQARADRSALKCPGCLPCAPNRCLRDLHGQDRLLQRDRHRPRVVSAPCGLDYKSIAKASKVRILHLSPRAQRASDLRRRGQGPFCCVRLCPARSGHLRVYVVAVSRALGSGGHRPSPGGKPVSFPTWQQQVRSFLTRWHAGPVRNRYRAQRRARRRTPESQWC